MELGGIVLKILRVEDRMRLPATCSTYQHLGKSGS